MVLRQDQKARGFSDMDYRGAQEPIARQGGSVPTLGNLSNVEEILTTDFTDLRVIK